MKMRIKGRYGFIAGLIFYGYGMCYGAALPITSLGTQADVIVVAIVKEIPSSGTAQLQISQVLKGQPGSANLIVSTSAPGGSPSASLVGPGSVGDSGLWFLKSSPTGVYQILPRDSRAHSSVGAFYSTSGSGPMLITPVGLGGLDLQLLTSLVGWYQSLANPSQFDDDALLVSVDRQRNDVFIPAATLLAAVQPLIAAPSDAQHMIGLIAAIRLGSEPAIGMTVSGISALRSNPRFALIESSIRSYTQPNSALPLLRQLVGLGIPGLDAAVGAAIDKIGGKLAIPAMVSLLDSADPEAQSRACQFIGRFTIFADADGNMRDSGPNGPLFARENLIYMNPTNEGANLTQSVAFWKSWWNTHRGSLGL